MTLCVCKNCFKYLAGICIKICNLHCIIHPNMFLLSLMTYQQSSSDQQGLDSTHSQCTQLSFPSLEPDLGHSCRMLLNHLLCQCSLSQIHSVGYQVDHSQLGESKRGLISLSPDLQLTSKILFISKIMSVTFKNFT